MEPLNLREIASCFVVTEQADYICIFLESKMQQAPPNSEPQDGLHLLSHFCGP